MPGVRPRRRLRLDNFQRQPDLPGACRQGQLVAQGKIFLALRREVQRQAAAGDGFTGGLHLPVQHFIIAGTEQVFADNADPQRGVRQQGKLEILLGMFRFNQRRMRAAIREHQPVHAELPIVWRVAKIPAIGPAYAAVLEGLFNCLIRPVPDKAALQARIFPEGLPVIGKITEAVAHRVRVFAENQRSLFTGQADPLFNAPFGHGWNQLIAFHASVHRADNIGRRAVGAAAFVLDRPRRIFAFQPVIHGFMVRTAAGLVPQ